MIEQAIGLPGLKVKGSEQLEKKIKPPSGEVVDFSQPNVLATPLPLKIINQPASEPIQQPKAVFLPKIGTLLENCGIRTQYVNPVEIGKGANHTVYLYSPPDEEQMVIKIPNESANLSRNEVEEKRSIKTITKAFEKFTLPTEIKTDKTTGKYCIIQKAVKGKAITNKNYKEGKIMSQLEEIVKLNHNLYQEQGISLDFVGMPGFMTWLRRQFGKLIMQRSEFEVSNLIVDEKDGSIKIIDYDLLEVKGDAGMKKKTISFLGFFVNRVLMKHYFGVDIKKPKK